jgi:PKD repeat protein
MKKIITVFASGVIILAAMATAPTFSQRVSNINELKRISDEKSKEFSFRKTEAINYANTHGIPVTIETPDGRFAEIQYISEDGFPQYFITDNAVSAATISTNHVYPGGSSGFNLNGSGITIRQWDAGAVRLTHQEFGGRAVMGDGVTTTNYHSTHVAGTLIASGVVPAAKGMAPAASLRSFDWNNDQSEMATEATAGALISNHSYGYVRGWYSNGSTWTWYGNPSISTLEDYLFGFYDSQAQTWDQIAYNAPYFLICKSAGNDRNEGPTGGPYPKDGPYDCIAHAGVAKNILTVGAVYDIPGGYATPSSVVMTAFSCWGPADDGRIKPDIVASGITLYSTYNTSNTSYNSLSGTSMSSPSVAGSLALLQQHWANLHGDGIHMLAATLKALVIETADEAGPSDGPDYMFGWGLMNTDKAALKISEDLSLNVIDELVLNNGAVYNRTVHSDGILPLKVTICWTDPAGTPVSPQLDPATAMLVNDLDLVITDGTNTYYPWKLDRNNPTNAATNDGENDADNVEVVYIGTPATGDYTITVTHKGTLTNGSQAFSIVLDGITEPAGENPPLADFSANKTSVQVGESVLFTDLSANSPTSWDWSFTPATVTFINGSSSSSENPEVTFDAVDSYTVTLQVWNDYGTDSKTNPDYIIVHNGIYTFPYTESFESGLGSWVQGTDDNFNWTRLSGASPLKKTGPSKANAGSYYLYTISSSPRVNGDKAHLTNTFDFTGVNNPQLSFYYHMYGSGMGTLAVDIYDGTWHLSVWSKTGQQHSSKTSSYTKATVNLSAFANLAGVIIRFRGVIGSTALSDMAFDNLQVKNVVARTLNLTVSGNDQATRPEVLSIPREEKIQIYAYDGAVNVGYTGTVGGTVEIYSLMGQKVYSGTITPSAKEIIPVKSGSGLYIVRLIVNGNVYKEKVFIK